MSNDLAPTAINTAAVVEEAQTSQTDFSTELSNEQDSLSFAPDQAAKSSPVVTQLVTQVPRISTVDVRRVVRDRKASEARNKARLVLNDRLSQMNHIEHIQLALEAIITEITEKNPKAEYVAKLLTYFMPEEKVLVAEALSTLIKEADIKISFWRGELSFSRVCKESDLSCEVRITSTNQVVMKSNFNSGKDELQADSDSHCCSVLDSFAFLNLCVHIWQVLSEQ